MPRRLTCVLALLATSLTLSAAPVPKETGKEMLRRVYGEVADLDSKVTCEPVGKGGLKVRVPTGVEARNEEDYDVAQPIRSREISGDFVVSTRIVHAVESKAISTVGNNGSSAAAGLSVLNESAGVGLRLMGTCGDRSGCWLCGIRGCYMRQRIEGSGFGPTYRTSIDDPTWLRLTRTGGVFTCEWSTDGKKWNQRQLNAKGFGDTVRVGVVAHQETDADYEVVFDHYELKPLTAEK